jgi:hypothetical protein
MTLPKKVSQLGRSSLPSTTHSGSVTRTTVLGLIAMAVAVGLLAVSLSRNAKRNTGGVGQDETGPAPGRHSSSASSDGAGIASSSRPNMQSPHYTPPEKLPAGWEDFLSLGEMEQLNRVTAAMENHSLAPDNLAFFEAEIFNRNHMDVTRNNMANALVWQEKPNPRLHELFIKMLEDETEDPVWRDYCLQFLSECLKSTSDPELVKTTLARYAKGKDSLAGTAIVHLAYQESEGRVQVDEAFSKQLETQLADPQVALATKVSILGVIGQRKDVRLLPLVRTYAKDRDASLKRCAIAALGQIGTQEDLSLVQAGLSDSNRAVQLAAKAAEERLQARLSVAAPAR